MNRRMRAPLVFRLASLPILRVVHWENATSRGWADVEFAGWVAGGFEPMTKAEARRSAAARGFVAEFVPPDVSGRGRWPKANGR
jgi:hypothetical protein